MVIFLYNLYISVWLQDRSKLTFFFFFASDPDNNVYIDVEVVVYLYGCFYHFPSDNMPK